MLSALTGDVRHTRPVTAFAARHHGTVKSDEAKDTGRAAGTYLRQVTDLVRGAHFAVSDTVHDAVGAVVGPSATPIRVFSDTITSGVYALTSRGVDAGARVVGEPLPPTG